jgi:hypothetical protein
MCVSPPILIKYYISKKGNNSFKKSSDQNAITICTSQNGNIVCLIVCVMVFNPTFNNISVLSWRSILLVEETGGPGETYRRVASHWQTLSHNVVNLALIEIRTHNIIISTPILIKY